MRAIFYLLLLLFFLFPVKSIGQNSDQAKIDSLFLILDTTKTDTGRLSLYYSIVSYYIYSKPEDGLKHVGPAMHLAEKLNKKKGILLLKMQEGRLYWRMGKFDSALIVHNEMLRMAREQENDEYIALAYQIIGQDYADGGNYEEAKVNFKHAYEIYKKMDDDIGQSNSLNLLAWVSVSQGNYSAATKYDYEALRLYEKRGDKSGIAVLTSNIAEYQTHLGNYDEAISIYKKAIALLQASDDKINLIGTYNSLGEVYKIKGDYKSAIESFNTSLKISNESGDKLAFANAFSGLGGIYSLQENYTEALNYYLKAEKEFTSVSNKQGLASLYSEIGTCYSRLKKFKDAKKYFDNALLLTNELNSTASLSDYYKGKEIYDSLTAGWESAYKNYKQYILIRDSTFNKSNLSKMLSSQMEYETEKKEAAARAEQEKKDIRQRTIRNSIIAVLAGVIIFLVVVYRQRNKIAKARKRSDELLLNILPEEVAEELKTKGSADAKHFDKVTVMFTDFKDFTTISEKLSPSELVAEIDTCFKAFDQIIQKHNVEKIKTIGDAYMCAGGLPVPNKTNAEEVVKAAIEIREFMKQHVNERKKSGRDPFEIRIGIHTGPVVAGIVGVKKFAYDIWGDTVNIASRMESSGMPGKINISETTFEIVKDKFPCTHRGKIQAKNKGEIDMYFVE